MLVIADGVIGESEAIFAWVDQRTPAERRPFPIEPEAREEAFRLCRRFDVELGPSGRRLI